MSIKQITKVVNQHYCDGCGKPLGCEIIYGYGTEVELGECCHKELRPFENYKMRMNYVTEQIKAQPFFNGKKELG